MISESINSEENLKLIDEILHRLFPLCRSITGEPNRESLRYLCEFVDLDIKEVKSGTQVFDWTVPEEWSVREAWIKDESGNKVVDFAQNNLHLVSYSEPVDQKISFAELKERLHTLPTLPMAIPYRTSYYKKTWGFCLSQERFDRLDQNQNYHVYVDSDFKPEGSLTYATAFHQGRSEKEILLSSYCCHPSMANDNLSGLITATLLFRSLQNKNTHYSYRLVLAPETIGAVTFLAEEYEKTKNIIGGAVFSTTGGPGKLGLKRSFKENSLVDEAAMEALKNNEWIDYPFMPDGSDERQFATPGFRIPTITITKSKYYEFDEYHTSLDNLNFVKPAQILESLQAYGRWVDVLEKNRVYFRKNPHCEYQLGKRGLYPSLGGQISQPGQLNDEKAAQSKVDEQVLALSWLMHSLDGKTSLVDIAKRSKIELDVLSEMASQLESKELIDTKEIQ